MRKRKIMYIGGTYYISLYKQDIEDYDLQDKDFVDIEDILKVKSK